jgi:arylsulfatase A-like enzyme
MAENVLVKPVRLAELLVGCGLACVVMLAVGCSQEPDTPQRLSGLTPLYSFADRFDEARIIRDQAVLDFGDPEGQDQLVAGWGTPESEPSTGTTFVWAVATEASIAIEVASSAATFLDFRCRPYVFPGAAPQSVELVVNGVSVSTVTLERGLRSYRLPIPGGVLVAGLNTVDFRFAYAASPLDHGAEDSRTLAAAFDVLTVGHGGPVERSESRPQATRESLAVPTGTAVVYTFRAPEQAILDFESIELRADGAASVAGEVWIRKPGYHFEQSALVDETASATGPLQLPLDVEAGSLVQVKLTAIGEAAAHEGFYGVVWNRPWLYGRQSRLEQLDDVVLIVVDTLRADFVGAYGGEVATPNIDALAEGGVLFRNAYSHIPITGPSHASLFTSLLPVDHGVHNNAQILGRHVEFLPAVLASHGSHTAAFVSLGVLNRRFGFARGFDAYHDEFGWDWTKDARELNSEVFDWLEEAPTGPRFLWIHYSDPHEPYAPPGLEYPRVRVSLGREELGIVSADGRGVSLPLTVPPGRSVLRFEAVSEVPPRGLRFPVVRVTDDRMDIQLSTGWSEHGKRFGDAAFDTLLPADAEVVNRSEMDVETTLEFSCKERLTVAEIRQRYAQEVSFVDHEIGALMNRLEETGRLDRTLLIFTSDHGEGLGDHKHVGHISQLYDTLIRVPLMMVYPGRIPAGEVVDDTVSLVDLAPTVTELLGFPLDAEVRGTSLVPLLEGGVLPDRPVIAETYRPEAFSDKVAIISRGFKYIWSRRDHEWVELYDLTKDPNELRDLSQKRPELLSELREAIDRELESSQRSPAIDADISEEDSARLRALGYVH